MRIVTLTILGLLFKTQMLLAQNNRVSLLVQSPDGKNVKLVWLFKSWGADITGFDIKRKDGLQGWVKLNKEPIIPGISMQKSLALTGVDKNEENVLKARLFKLLASHKLQETLGAAYLQKLASDEKALQDIMQKMAADYDLAIMNGFAYTDHSVTQKTDYQYGLFIQGTDNLLAKVTWNYGQIPDLNTIEEITSKATTKSNGVQLIWNANLPKMKAGDVAGFNIYRQGIRLNNDPIIAVNNNDLSEFTWNDKSANSKGPIQYSVSAESIFGIEGIVKSYTYDPADHPSEYVKAKVTEVASSGYYFKEGINVKWTFPKEYEHFIKGFYVEKDNMPGGYKQVSKLLDPAARTFTDVTPSPITGYIRFKAVAVYNDRTAVHGVERMYNYFPITEPPSPVNVKAKYEAKDKRSTVRISWDLKINGDSATDHYKVYVYDEAKKRFVTVNDDKPIRYNSYIYTCSTNVAAVYRFCVTAVSRAATESAMTDTIVVQTATLELSAPSVSKGATDSTKATIQWQYADVADLKGFRVYLNKNLVAGEEELKRDAREYTVTRLVPGMAYDITVRAITESGLLSDHSTPLSIVATAVAK